MYLAKTEGLGWFPRARLRQQYKKVQEVSRGRAGRGLGHGSRSTHGV